MENLKVFEQLTDNELLSLSQEDIDWYIELKKAETGIKIIKCPETPIYREIPKTDLKLYDVLGLNFESLEDATDIANFVNTKISSAFNIHSDYWNSRSEKYAEPYNGKLAEVKIESVYKQETYNSIKDVILSNKKIEDSYNELKREYDDEQDKSQEIINNIYNKISDARERRNKFIEYIDRIKDYLRLSNGNEDIAWNFFTKAYEIDVETKNRIIENEEYINCVNGYKI